MNARRKIEVFTAGCPVCEKTVELVKREACASCEVSVLDMNQPDVAERARKLGVGSVPAVAIDDKLADCCAGRGPSEATLRAAGLGQQTTLHNGCVFNPVAGSPSREGGLPVTFPQSQVPPPKKREASSSVVVDFEMLRHVMSVKAPGECSTCPGVAYCVPFYPRR